MVIESTAAPVLAPVEVAIVAALGGGRRPSIPIAALSSDDSARVIENHIQFCSQSFKEVIHSSRRNLPKDREKFSSGARRKR
jgi:hypothetical protein